MKRYTDFSHKAIVITGGSGTFGSMMAKRFALLGAHVALVARRVDRLQSVAYEIRESGGKADFFVCDVSILDEVKATVDAIHRNCGVIDILINNAGYVRHRPFLNWDIDDQENIMRVNYFGSMYFTKLLLPNMIKQGDGCIVFIASAGGKIGVPDETAFAASQFAIVGLAEALSLEVEDEGVHVLTMLPGSFESDYFDLEDMRRLPPVTKNNLLNPSIFIDALFKALATGNREVTCPRHIATGYIVKALAPNFMRKQVKRVTLDAIK